MTNRAYFLIASAFAILLGVAQASPARAEDDSPITYTVTSGDTLVGLAKKYMVGPQSAEIVRRLNDVRQPTRMQPGTVLRIPRAQLRSVPVLLSVQNLSGPVTIIAGANRKAASTGAVVRAGMEIQTGRKGFVTLSGTRGSLVTIPSQSHARLRSAKTYLINDTLDVDFEIISGRSSIRAPKLRSQERFRSRTPVAVSAVRGTEFRVGFDPQTALGITEVDEGEVAVSGETALATAKAGFGVAANTTGVKQPEALLRAPAMQDATRTQTGEMLDFAIIPLPEATGYRVQIARDAGFLEIVDEQLSAAPAASFSDIPNGRYSVRSRAVAASGLEGLSETYSFRRQRVGVTASVDKSPLADGFKFSWTGQGAGQSTGESETLYAFQIWDEAAPGTLLVDELGMSETAIILTDLRDGKYAWRVAALQMVPEGLVKVWSDPQTLTVQN